MPLNRRQELTQAHTWLSEDDISLMLVHKYQKYSDEYEPSNVQPMLDNFTKIACRLPEQALRDLLSRVQEFAVI
ncbi:hypothetical protein SynSYN20_01747 [Synechococcus sp. SYN20]|nr:hypothetical protein SynSYN20_01747 [Synechococcus sp. SYN20]